MATVVDYFGVALSQFPALGARAVDACRERATTEIIESGSDDEATPLMERCSKILSDWGISKEDMATASDSVVGILTRGGAETINTEALVMMLISELTMIGYNKFMDNHDPDSPFIRMGRDI